jgi:hypothetical protein
LSTSGEFATVAVMRALVISLALVACGSSSAPATPTPAADEPKLERPTAEVPQHDSKMLASGDDEAVNTVAAQGSMSASLNGVATTFTFLPYGGNVASWSQKTGVARLALAGAPSDRGMPLLRLVIENVRIDQMQLPATFTIGSGQAAGSAEPRTDTPRPRVEYVLEERKTWHGGPDGDAIGSVTIESYSGKRVKGSFKAKLTPRSSAFGPPIELGEGRFDIELRLQGIQPGPTP